MQNRFVRGIRYVPTLPTVLSQILALLNNQNSSAQDLEAIIIHDQALSSKVLAVANSAYYGFRHQILTVTRAVVALGYEEIRNICLGASLMGFLHPSSFRNQKAAELLWLHSLTVADAATLVAERLDKSQREAAFTAGLLHDLGKVVLAAFFPDEAAAIKDLMTKENLPYREAEKALDMDHGMVGQALAEHWDLPQQLGEVMGFHHLPHVGLLCYPMVATVHVADYLARSINLGHSGNPDRPEVLPQVLSRLEMSRPQLAELRGQLDARRVAVIDLWQTLIKA
ncbi:MAG: HDOD domain-containing protein [Pseudomonadota bacterium]